MSVTLDTAVSPTDARPAYDSVRLHTSATPPSRQIRDGRYNSRTSSRIFQPRQASVISSQSQLLLPLPGTGESLDTTQNHTNEVEQPRLQEHIERQARSIDVEEVYNRQDHDRMDAEMESDEVALARDSADVEAPIASVPAEVAITDDTMDMAADAAPIEAEGAPQSPQPPLLEASDGQSSSPLTPALTTEEGTPEDDDIDDQDSEGRISEDEPHNSHTHLGFFEEDETTPDEEELNEIMEHGEETNAEDHEHWQTYTFESLEDPEYVPTETGRISWVLKGIYGTEDKRIFTRILRSPSVLIDGLYWNIKFFPRGNEGTEQMSVYIECSRTPYEKRGPVEQQQCTARRFTVPVANMVANPVALDRPGSNGEESPSRLASQGESQPEAVKSSPTLPAMNDPEAEVLFDVATQIGCVVYNPAEPRVHFEQKSSHRFCDENPDWGWTRFCGPWLGINKRRRLQRQALIRQDTLAFTAYIRTVKDDTGSLWWHPPRGNPAWNSVARCGQRGLSHVSVNRSATISAFSTLLHLAPIAEALRGINVAQPFVVPQPRPLPFVESLKSVLDDMGISALPSHSTIPLEGLAQAAQGYGVDLNSKTDVIELWDKVRQLVKIESQQSEDFGLLESLLDRIWTFRQPNQASQITEKLANGVPEQSPNNAHRGKTGPDSVQKTIDNHPICYNKKGGGDHPWCLQVELHRQSYDIKKRKWKKTTHQIELNETVRFLDNEYTLFSMVVHQGDLESGVYFSIIQPQGPGTKWFQYYNDSGRKGVVGLTQKQARQAHEGNGVEAEGTAAVAYVAVYLKHDISQALKNYQLDRPLLRADNVRKRNWNMALHHDDIVDVHIWRDDCFLKHRGRGILDPWVTSNENIAAFDGPESSLVKIRLPASKSLRLVKHALGKNYPADAYGKFWALNMSNWTTVNFMPGFERVRDDMTLCELARYTRGFHLWYVSLPPDIAPATLAMDRSDGLPEDQLQHEIRSASPVQEEIVWGITDEDVVMEGIQDIIVGAPNHRATPSDPMRGWDVSPVSTPCHGLYCFLKVFDPVTQNLSAVSALFAQGLEDLSEIARDELSMATDQAIDLYQEHGFTVTPANLQENMAWSGHGVIYIAQKHLSEPEIADLENTGKPATVTSYFKSLAYLSNFSHRQPHFLTHYFSKPHADLTLSHGFAHGPGITIHLSGDAFRGNYTLGTRNGTGTMFYTSGDTYTGTWLNDLRHGTGTMTYGATGNVYTGGWRKGKRHGKGRMDYQVADEEANLCRICYDKEMDVVLYDCGHILACEECAKSVEVCPCCRKSVKAVVKYWKI